MDLVLDLFDRHLFTPYIYPETWAEDDIVRQLISLYIILFISASSTYLTFATLNYYFIFDHTLKKHPLFLKNQIRREIKQSIRMNLGVSFFFLPLIVLEVRGYSKLHYDTDSISGFKGILTILLNFISFLVFCDFLEYWIHRWLHLPSVYRHLHKKHHLLKVPSPFGSYHLTAIDSFLEGSPYLIYPFVFPQHKLVYLFCQAFVLVWAISVHDNVFCVPDMLKPYCYGAAHHLDHHLFYSVNYGNFFTFWDRVGGSYRTPSVYEGRDLREEAIAYSQSKKGQINGTGITGSSKLQTRNGHGYPDTEVRARQA